MKLGRKENKSLRDEEEYTATVKIVVAASIRPGEIWKSISRERKREKEIYCWQEIDLSVRWIETRLPRLLNVLRLSWTRGEEREREKGVKARAEKEEEKEKEKEEANEINWRDAERQKRRRRRAS